MQASEVVGRRARVGSETQVSGQATSTDVIVMAAPRMRAGIYVLASCDASFSYLCVRSITFRLQWHGLKALSSGAGFHNVSTKIDVFTLGTSTWIECLS